jgi:hypothetical protein
VGHRVRHVSMCAALLPPPGQDTVANADSAVNASMAQAAMTTVMSMARSPRVRIAIVASY